MDGTLKTEADKSGRPHDNSRRTAPPGGCDGSRADRTGRRLADSSTRCRPAGRFGGLTCGTAK
ncbi:hypothetical protein Misp01_53070 [Microtetraspora sp. NBRC 13810]|nr:hypothetical protein Misp01_53070 [Microtetraspora sp. NBRC 13810]